MALVKCEECNKDISSEAEVCPQCGFKPKRTGCLGIFGYGILVVIAISFLGRCALEAGSSHIGRNKALPLTGSYSCSDKKVVHYAKSPTGTVNDIVSRGIEVRLNISDDFLSLDAKLNGLPQNSKPMPYKVQASELVATAPLIEDQRTDPMTKKPWINSRTEVVNVDLKTGQMKRLVRNESLTLDRKVSSFETFVLTAKCQLK